MSDGVVLWNLKDLCPPPNSTYRVKKENKILVELRLVCLKASCVLTDLNGLHYEGAVLSRMIYIYKCKFRNEKSFRAIEKVNRSLRRYSGLDLAGAFSGFTPGDPDWAETHGYLPSRQMLQFVLVRTQGFARLLRHMADVCEEAARGVAPKLATGHFLGASLLFYAVVSRIWAYARYLVFSACEWFNKLKQFLDVLEPNPTPWLPEGHSFPSDLADWLNIGSWTEAPRPMQLSHTQRLLSLFASKRDEEVEHAMETESEDEKKSSLAVNVNGKICGAGIRSSLGAKKNKVPSSSFSEKLVKKKKKKKSLKNNLSPANYSETQTQDDSIFALSPTLNYRCDGEDLGESVCRDSLLMRTGVVEKRPPDAEGGPLRRDAGRRTPGTKRSRLEAIASHGDLSALVRRESEERLLTRGLDKLQWRLLRKSLNNSYLSTPRS
ncbi:uncharacterized protein LOC134530942 isoform X1 [Bacillus rossius redtenbacheri]|uniref:uncharacterized protein LOC134530942 isoform X1 n=1 Tax=Bacillus rossius redtenbacheri TaxID=93214 RepID=UPI002FDCD87D